MFGCGYILLNKINVEHIKLGEGLINHLQSVKRRVDLVVKTIVARSEWDRQNQYKNHEQHNNLKSYKNSAKKEKKVKKLHMPMLLFFGI